MKTIEQDVTKATEILRSRAMDEPTMWQFAERLSNRLQAGDTLLLDGNLGAGKTSFARAIIRAVLNNPDEPVPSPTFTLVQTYEAPDVEVIHADLYRLGDLSEVYELGILEDDMAAIRLIEWPERLGGLAPPEALRIEFKTIDDQRQLVLTSEDASWQDRLGDFQ